MVWHRENRKKIPVTENTGNLEMLQKHKENTGNLEMLQKHKENTGNLEMLQKHKENSGNLVAQVVNSLVLKVKGIPIFAAKIPNYILNWISLPSQFCVCNSHKSRKFEQGKFAVGQGKKQGKHREFYNVI